MSRHAVDVSVRFSGQMANRRIAIKDVAAAAGVSITTVSHALNGKGRLPEKTRERVRLVAEGLGYRPSPNARSLGGGHSGLLALAISQVDDLDFHFGDFDYFVQLISAATREALNRGFALAVASTADAGDTLERIPIDGAIVVDPSPGDRSVAKMRKQGKPIVTTGRILDGEEGGNWVDNDHVAGIHRILDHLDSAGAGRIALVAPRSFASYVADVRTGYASWCAEHERQERVVTVGDVTEAEGFEAATSLLDSPQPPDAIYAVLDRLAVGVLLGAEARGVDVPAELLVAACSDSRAAQSARPPLTTLSLDPERIGAAAVGMLIDLVEGRDLDPAHMIVPTTVIERQSTMAEQGGRAKPSSTKPTPVDRSR